MSFGAALTQGLAPDGGLYVPETWPSIPLSAFDGVDGFYLRGVPRLKVPRMKMADGPFGINVSHHYPLPANHHATAMAAGIGMRVVRLLSSRCSSLAVRS